MDCTDKNKLFVLAILIVLLTSWVIGNFLYIIIRAPADSGASSISADEIGKAVTGSENTSHLFNILITAFIIIIILLLVITIIGVLMESDLALLTQISVIILVILITTTVFALRINSEEVSGESDETITNDFDLPTGRDIFDKTTSYGHIIFPILLTSILVIIISELKKGKDENLELNYLMEEENKSSELQKKEDISSDFENIRNELMGGEGVRIAIINSYKNMMNIFEKRGIKFEPSMTSREFMNYAMTNFDVSDEIISDITNLFEEARYSSHELDELYREQALNDLKKLEEELKR